MVKKMIGIYSSAQKHNNAEDFCSIIIDALPKATDKLLQ